MPTVRGRWVREQLAFLVVAVGVGIGFVLLLASPGQWRLGVAFVAVFVLVAGAARMLLPTARVGFLAVRARVVDTVLYLVIGVLILVVDLRLQA